MTSEWFDMAVIHPPRDGTWIIATYEDCSGLLFLSYVDDGWIDGSGALDSDDEDLRFHYGAWCLAPKWMRPHAVEAQRKVDQEVYMERVMARVKLASDNP